MARWCCQIYIVYMHLYVFHLYHYFLILFLYQRPLFQSFDGIIYFRRFAVTLFILVLLHFVSSSLAVVTTSCLVHAVSIWRMSCCFRCWFLFFLLFLTSTNFDFPIHLFVHRSETRLCRVQCFSFVFAIDGTLVSILKVNTKCVRKFIFRMNVFLVKSHPSSRSRQHDHPRTLFPSKRNTFSQLRSRSLLPLIRIVILISKQCENSSINWI